MGGACVTPGWGQSDHLGGSSDVTWGATNTLEGVSDNGEGGDWPFGAFQAISGPASPFVPALGHGEGLARPDFDCWRGGGGVCAGQSGYMEFWVVEGWP